MVKIPRFVHGNLKLRLLNDFELIGMKHRKIYTVREKDSEI